MAARTERPELEEFAAGISDKWCSVIVWTNEDQQAEIERMEQWQEEWSWPAFAGRPSSGAGSMASEQKECYRGRSALYEDRGRA